MSTLRTTLAMKRTGIDPYAEEISDESLIPETDCHYDDQYLCQAYACFQLFDATSWRTGN